MNDFETGQRVRIERDEKLHPSVGTWPRYSGKPGIVAIINEASDEVGVEVGAVQARYRETAQGRQLDYDHAKVAWFRPFELRASTS